MTTPQMLIYELILRLTRDEPEEPFWNQVLLDLEERIIFDEMFESLDPPLRDFPLHDTPQRTCSIQLIHKDALPRQNSHETIVSSNLQYVVHSEK